MCTWGSRAGLCFHFVPLQRGEQVPLLAKPGLSMVPPWFDMHLNYYNLLRLYDL